MTYEQVRADVFAHGTVPDGYFGDRQAVGFHFDAESGKTLIVADQGYYNSGLPPANDVEEALWLLRHHPRAKEITLTAEE